MKRTILASIIGIAAAMAVQSAHAQGSVFLDNYTTSGNRVLYGAGSGGTAGTGISGPSWTIGIYGAVGNVSVAADPTGIADPTTLGALNLLSTSTGLLNGGTGTFAGYFADPTAASLPGYTSGAATFMVVAFNGSTYDTSTDRSHSAAINNVTPSVGAATPPYISSSTGGMQSFSVLPTGPVPEPSVFALSGIGAAALMLIRRKK